MSSYVCIIDLISFMFAESKRLMNGTKFENNWYFYHYALSLMKAKDAKEWMRKEGILDKCILPLNELNKGTSFEGHPVGNSPELMPLHCSLFNDVSVNYHINITRKLSENDDKKFSMSSIKRGVRAYLRILEPTADPNAGCPSSKRICQDCSKWIDHLVRSEYTHIIKTEYTLIFQTEYTCNFHTGGQRPPRATQSRAPREFIY